MAAWVVILPVVILLLTWWYFRNEKVRRKVDRIPGPKPLPLLGNAHQLGQTSRKFYDRMDGLCRQYKDFGIFRLWLSVKPLIAVYKPEYVEKILQSTKHIDKASEYRFLHPWLGTGLLTSTGAKWRMRRKMLTPTFHFNILNDFVGVFHDQAQVLMKRLEQVGDGKTFNIFNYITLCALDIICETAMGRTINAQSDSNSEYVKCIYKMTELVLQRQRTPWYWPDILYNSIGYGKEHNYCLKVLHDFTLKVINEKLEERSKSKDPSVTMEDILQSHSSDDTVYVSKGKRLAFLDMLLCSEVDGSELSISDIREEVDTFMFEGHDTTAAAMNWAVHLIGANPHVQKKVHEELDQIFGDSDRPTTMKDLKNMKYLECCIKIPLTARNLYTRYSDIRASKRHEALRLFPSVPYFGRSLTEDTTFDDYEVPKGATVVVTTVALHTQPDHFPDAETYDPDRFLPENASKRHPYAYVPFSAGPRNCIGQKFALLEEKTILSTIFRKYEITSKQTREELLPIGDLIMRPEYGIFIELKTR